MIRIALAIAAVTLIVGGAAAAAVYFLNQDHDGPPDLTLHDTFPKGFDRQSLTLQAVGFDGKSRCLGASALFSSKAREWTHDGIAYTTNAPTAKQILTANPLPDPAYDYVGKPSSPWKANQTDLPEIQTDIVCAFRYEAAAYATRSDVANVKAVPLTDPQGAPFLNSRTPVVLDPNGATRFLMQGHSADPEIAVGVSLYRLGDLQPDGLLYQSTAEPVVAANGSFAVVFDVPATAYSKATLMLIPFSATPQGPRAVPNDQIHLSSLHRLETSEAQLILAPTGPIQGPAPQGAATWGGGVVYRAPTLEEAGRKAQLGQVVERLEGASHAAFLVQKAFEPEAPLHKVRHYQAITVSRLTTTTRLEMTEAGAATLILTTYDVQSTAKSTAFVVKQATSTSAIEKAAEATAAVTQIGADGVAVVRAAASGPSAQAAIETTHRLLDARGQAAELRAAPLAADELLHGPQRYFIAAGALAAGWEWSQAFHANDDVQRIVHGVKAARIVAETLFSLNPQGAIIVAATNLAAFAVDQLLPASFKALLSRGFNAGILGKVPEDSARSAFNRAVPDIEAFAKANNAGILDHKVAKTHDVPGFSALTAPTLFALALLFRRRRGNP